MKNFKDPKKIAYGFALGTFLGFLPFIGLQAAIAVLIALLIKWDLLLLGTDHPKL